MAWEGNGKTSPAIQLAFTLRDGGVRRVRMPGVHGNLPALSARDGRLAVAWLDGESVKLLRATDAAR